MLSIGLTGGIAAGKSLLAARFKELGALLIDADQLARDVVAPGTPGLAAIVERFGAGLLLPDGSLNRPALGDLVFGEPEARTALNSIIHPLVRAAAKELQDSAGPGDIVVQDIPLLVETGQGTNFHLVVVVQAPPELRIERMVRDRGMSADDARARMAAQASDEEREAVADVVIVNGGEPKEVLCELDRLWQDRLLPYARNLALGVPAQRDAGAPAHADPASPAHADPASQAARVQSRLAAAAGGRAVSVGRIGATTVTGGTAADVLEFELLVPGRESLASLAPVLAAAGYPRVSGSPDAAPVHRSADPGLAVTVRLRVAG